VEIDAKAEKLSSRVTELLKVPRASLSVALSERTPPPPEVSEFPKLNGLVAPEVPERLATDPSASAPHGPPITTWPVRLGERNPEAIRPTVSKRMVSFMIPAFL
jgi:hypothetical protein